MQRALAGISSEQSRAARLVYAVLRATAAATLVMAGYLIAAGVGGVAPFEGGEEPLSPVVAMAELPEEFARPPEASLEYAGEGERLPYGVVWTSRLPVAELARLYESMLAGDRWELVLAEEAAPNYRIRLARIGEQGEMTHWAMLDVAPLERGSRVSLEFYITGGRVEFR